MHPTGGASDRRLTVSWGIFFVLLFLYRSVFSVLGEVVVMRLTPISDTFLYQSGILEQTDFWANFGPHNLMTFGPSTLSTALTAALGKALNIVFFGNAILINIGFQTITFAGLVYLIMSIRPAERKYLAVLVLLPSFSVWTSIASKEAIVAGAVAVAAGYLIRLYTGSGRLRLIHVAAGTVIYIFKTQYLAALAFFFLVTVIARRVRQSAAVATIIGAISLVALWFSSERLDELAQRVQTLLIINPGARSTRTELFFTDPLDVILKAPVGMFRSFVGPTLAEVPTSVLHLITFVESMVVVGFLLYLFLSRVKQLPAYNAIVGFFVLFWISFATYPFGVMNAGSAIRYRSGWILIVMVVFATFLSREVYTHWKSGRSLRRPVVMKTQ